MIESLIPFISSKSCINNGDNNYNDSEITLMIILIVILIIVIMIMIIIIISIKDVDKIFANAYDILLK